MLLLKPYYDDPMLVDGVTIVNYLFAKMKSDTDKKTEAKIKAKIKEKMFEHKYVTYSNFEKLGASCVINDLQEVVSYLGKVIKEGPLNKYIVKEWPIMVPFLENLKVIKLLTPAQMVLDKIE